MYNINEITKFIIIGIILLNCFKNTNLNKDKSKGNSHFPYNESNLINSSYNLNMNKKNNNNTIIYSNNSKSSINLSIYLNKNFLIRNRNKSIKKNKRIIKDVLFINGCNPKILPHPYRFRVLHQIEQLKAGFLESDKYYYENFDPLIVLNYRVIILFRCPWTEKIEEAISLARDFNKKILFDIDDLVIDTKYTDNLPYLKAIGTNEKALYDDGVMRMGKTLKHCDGAITTTEVLAKELNNYISNVFINHNVASEEMWRLSQNALIKRNNKKNHKQIIIGYFSGSITHNSDIEMIKPVLFKILKKFHNVKLLLLGELSLLNFLSEFSTKIIYRKFKNWKKLPKTISNVDINIAPIEKNIFNEAKSENKWFEAALVKIPTIASNYGEFKHAIIHNVTGLLCSDNKEWYDSLETLIDNENLRKTLGENAYNICKYKYNTIYSGKNFANYINSFSNKHIGFFLPSLQISGGIYVILKHACILKDNGWDVDLIVNKFEMNLFKFQDHNFNVISLNSDKMTVQYDVIVATLYTTLFDILKYYRTKKHIYLVQGYETDFFPYGYFFRGVAEKTYSVPFGVEYITISKWCENWLWKKYRKISRYAHNGIDLNEFNQHRREFSEKKIRILVEGDSSSFYKNVDESFKIIEKLDKNKFEIWYLSYNGKPKDWYKIDKFINKLPHEKVNKIYEECDILLKSSWLESFSYPPLEMMATGGYCIVVPNEGNKEYLIDGQNCLFYKLGDLDSAMNNIKRLIADTQLQNHLYKYGLETAKKRNWKNFQNEIINLYSN